MNFKKSILSFLAFSALTAFSGLAAAAPNEISVFPNEKDIHLYWKANDSKPEDRMKLNLYGSHHQYVGVAEIFRVDADPKNKNTYLVQAAPIFTTCTLKGIASVQVSEVLNNQITKEIAESKKIKNWNAPSSGPIIRGYGFYKSQFDYEKFYCGVQYAAHGQPIYAVEDGELLIATTDSALFGSLTVLQHNDDTLTEYGGIITPAKSMDKGTKFKAGEIIGYALIEGKVFFGVIVDGDYQNPMNYLK